MRWVAIALAAAVGFAASPAAAQLASSRSGSSSLEFIDRTAAMKELTLFGRCYAKKRRDAALSLIATRPSSREEVEVYRKLFRTDNLPCLTAGMTLRAPISHVRGAIAEGLLRAELGVPPEYKQPAPTLAEVRNLSDAARCYAAAHRGEVQALLTTAPGSREEYNAVAGLAADFLACVPAGAKTDFSVTVVRYRLAEALLRLPSAAAAVAGK